MSLDDLARRDEPMMGDHDNSVLSQARQLAARLREAERSCTGRQRDLWGHAAANAAAAAATRHRHALRWLWTTACDYARQAAEAGGDAPGHPVR